jgi:MFS family permease
LSKPIFPLATSVAWVLTGRFVDRIGKGIRGAPRDALVADITPPEHRGAAYGLRQALDSAGAVIGPLLAIVLMALLHDDIRTVLWAAVIPAAMAVLLVAVAVREPPRPSAPANGHARLTTAAIAQLPRACWLVVLLGAVFTLARFSEAFLILRAQDVGLRLAYVPAVLIVMNVVYAGTAYPAGWAADRVSRRALLVAGLAVLVGGDVVLAFAATPTHVLAGVACWGLHMGLTQGLMAKLVADTAPPRLRGTAFGLFNLAAGAALLLASAIAGSLWSTLGPGATFIGGALVAALAAAGVLAYQPRPRRAPCSVGLEPRGAGFVDWGPRRRTPRCSALAKSPG